MLSNRQYFFTDIEEGILLYDTTNIPFAKRKPLSPVEAKVIAQEHYGHWFETATGFLSVGKFSF
jgi:uncharacterized protein